MRQTPPLCTLCTECILCTESTECTLCTKCTECAECTLWLLTAEAGWALRLSGSSGSLPLMTNGDRQNEWRGSEAPTGRGALRVMLGEHWKYPNFGVQLRGDLVSLAKGTACCETCSCKAVSFATLNMRAATDWMHIVSKLIFCVFSLSNLFDNF